MIDLENAFKIVDGFSSGSELTKRISDIESTLKMKDINSLNNFLDEEGINENVIEAALKIKLVSGQINVFIHAFGIIMSLPHILLKDEKILNLSLGAGNTGKEFDLETNKRVAEFKFTKWRGADAMRQNSLFIDLFNLVEYETNKKRCLYVVNKDYAIRFLIGQRSINSVLERNNRVLQRFIGKYGVKYKVVSQYYNDVKDMVEIIDLGDLVQVFK